MQGCKGEGFEEEIAFHERHGPETFVFFRLEPALPDTNLGHAIKVSPGQLKAESEGFDNLFHTCPKIFSRLEIIRGFLDHREKQSAQE